MTNQLRSFLREDAQNLQLECEMHSSPLSPIRENPNRFWTVGPTMIGHVNDHDTGRYRTLIYGIHGNFGRFLFLNTEFAS